MTELSPLSAKADCQAQTSELATYLQRGEIAMAARDSGVSATWMIQAPGKTDAQIAFGGYDGQAKQAARVRGIGSARDHMPRVFSTGSQWTVSWFDADGLAFARPAWDKISPPTLEHLRAVSRDLAEDVALASTPAGSLVAVAPFGAERTQLGLFLFAPTDPAAPAVQALGVSRHTVKPHRPAVAADEDGYYVGWLGGEDAIKVSHFDIKGREADMFVIAPAGTKRHDLSLIALPSGAIALWIEGDMIVARALGKSAGPLGPPKVVAKGARFIAATSLAAGALVAWIGKEGKADGQLAAVKLSADASPSSKGLILTDEGHAVKDPPAVAVTGARAAFAWTEVMSATVSTKRALLRTVEVACLP